MKAIIIASLIVVGCPFWGQSNCVAQQNGEQQGVAQQEWPKTLIVEVGSDEMLEITPLTEDRLSYHVYEKSSYKTAILHMSMDHHLIIHGSTRSRFSFGADSGESVNIFRGVQVVEIGRFVKGGRTHSQRPPDSEPVLRIETGEGAVFISYSERPREAQH